MVALEISKCILIYHSLPSSDTIPLQTYYRYLTTLCFPAPSDCAIVKYFMYKCIINFHTVIIFTSVKCLLKRCKNRNNIFLPIYLAFFMIFIPWSRSLVSLIHFPLAQRISSTDLVVLVYCYLSQLLFLWKIYYFVFIFERYFHLVYNYVRKFLYMWYFDYVIPLYLIWIVSEKFAII